MDDDILIDLDFIPKPFIYYDKDLNQFILLCFYCNPNHWGEHLTQVDAELALKRHIRRLHRNMSI